MGAVGSVVAASLAWAQPTVSEDGRVTFRLAAPAAAKVELYCDNVSRTELQRGADGTWTATTARLEPDLYGYVFVVDGVRMTDPANPSETHVSLVLVPDRTGPRPWERTDVPRGVVHRHSYRSAVAGEEREFLVYTPPGYDGVRKDFPVLYLLHGAGDQPPGWTALGRAHVILDNLIAGGAAVPMVVVMPSTFGRESRHHPPPASGAAWLDRPEIWKKDAVECREILRREIRPQVEALYRVRRGAQDRAVAGLSLGGAHSLAAGLQEPGDYGWVGAFSSGGPFRIYARDFAGAFPAAGPASPVRLLWISCGRDDGLFGINREFSTWLEGRGVRHRWVETAGGHNWTVWRRNLAEFVPHLFRAGR